jgi:hypothetical protein
MTKRKKMGSTDPRKAGGSIAGPGGPRDKNAVVLSTEHAVLLENTMVAEVETYRGGQPTDHVIGMTLAGRINHTDERAEILYLFDTDGAAAIITELLGLTTRMGPEVFEHVMDRIERLKDDDAIGTVG